MKKKVLALLLCLILFLSLCACGSAKNARQVSFSATEEAAEYESTYYAGAADTAPAAGLAMNARSDASNSAVRKSENSPENDPEKIIYSANVTVETTTFDTSLEAVDALVERFGAWVESSSVNGSNFYDISRGYASTRNASYTLRVPSDRFEELMSSLSELGNVPYSHVYTENVSAQYYDTQARMEAYQAQEARLLELMEEAETVEDVITIESRLSDLRYEIESLQSSLNNWDRRVSYSSVYLELQEVREYTQETPVQIRFGERLSRAFRNGIQGFVSFCQDALLWFVEALPALVIFAVAVFVVLRVLKSRKKKKAAAQSSKQD